MTAQAKNRILAYIVSAMLVMIALGAIFGGDPEAHTSTVLLPTYKPTLITVTEEPSIDQAEFECLRTNLYHEAGNQSRRGMEAVALVTLERTRTKGYPPTICRVVTVRAMNKKKRRWECAFSWFCDSKADVPTLTMTVRVKGKKKVVPNLAEEKAWEMATAVAQDAMEGEIKDFLGGATHYHADYVRPGWASAKRMHMLATVGDHVFYRDTLRKHKA